MNVIRSVSFICHECQQETKNPGAVLTKEGLVYLTSDCPGCNAIITLELSTVVASLYTVPFAKESKLIH